MRRGGTQVVAVAARTPVGASAEGTAAAIRAGISRMAEHPFMVDPTGTELLCARDPELAPNLFGVQRMIALLRHAIAELAEKVTASGTPSGRVPLLLATPCVRPGFDAAARRSLSQAFAAQPVAGVELQIELVGEGHAGSLVALQTAVSRMESAAAPEMIWVGGVDTYLQADTLDWLDAQELLACGKRRSGMRVGEGAVLLALMKERTRKTLRLPWLATCAHSGLSMETRNPRSPEGMLGEGLTRAIQVALAEAGSADHLYCDINGERWRADDWGFTALRCGELLGAPSDYTTAHGAIGDLGAATGALSCLLAVQAWSRGYCDGARALVCGSSWNGERAAVLLERGES